MLEPHELTALLTCEAVPAERRALYGLVARQGARLSEIENIPWPAHDASEYLPRDLQTAGVTREGRRPLRIHDLRARFVRTMHAPPSKTRPSPVRVLGSYESLPICRRCYVALTGKWRDEMPDHDTCEHACHLCAEDAYPGLYYRFWVPSP